MKPTVTTLALLAILALAGNAPAASVTIANSGFEVDNALDNSFIFAAPSSWTQDSFVAAGTTGSVAAYVVDKQWLNTVPPGAAPGLIAGAHSGDQYYMGFVGLNEVAGGGIGTTFSILHQDTGLAWSSLSAGDVLTTSVWATYRNDYPGSPLTAMWLNYPDGAPINSAVDPGWFDVSSTGPAAGLWTELTWNYTVTQAHLDLATANSWGAVNLGIGFQDTTQGSQVAFDDVSMEWTQIPEPSVTLALGLAVLATGLRRRRHD